VRDLGDDAPLHCALPYHDEPPRMLGEATGERPFRIGAFLLRGSAAHRPAFGRDAGKLERQQSAQRFLLLRMAFENSSARVASTPLTSIASAGSRNVASPRLTMPAHMSVRRQERSGKAPGSDADPVDGAQE
jgi:hypothetical protein